ncbi:hypothetical protein AGLY_008273 [Aphis glycines]|uniref:Uncharacterized protein n=1 Tax=Aphis glycines TaxID=307491 RepID=A0A6G0TLT9_APHGL|nr:hypothetical protein AGLY_008273 [Aphis glycines]
MPVRQFRPLLIEPTKQERLSNLNIRLYFKCLNNSKQPNIERQNCMLYALEYSMVTTALLLLYEEEWLVGVLGQTVGHDRTRGTAANHHEIVLVPDLGDPAVRQPVMDVLDFRPEEEYGHAEEHYVADAGPVRHGDSGGQPGRERVGRHARRRRPVNGHCRRQTRRTSRVPRHRNRRHTPRTSSTLYFASLQVM